MDPYRKYLKERLGRDLLELPGKGWASYKIEASDCYIVDIFIEKEFRKKGVATDIANAILEIAKKAGCKTLSGSVDLRAANPEISTLALLHYGFKFHSALDHFIIFKKDI